MERRLEATLETREIEQVADDPPEARCLGAHDPRHPPDLVGRERARGENLAESPERRERRPELVRGDGDKSGLRAVQLFEMARGGRDPRLQLVGEPPGPRREPRVLQRDGDVGAERLERRALLVAELADPLDGEHADRLTGHDERRGEHSPRPPAAARVGHEHPWAAGEHAGGDGAGHDALGAHHDLPFTVAHDQPDVGRAKAVEEHGAHRAKRGLERRHVRERALHRQNRLVPCALAARAGGERAAEGANTPDEREGHEPLDRLRREPRALERGKHDGGVEDERGPGAQRAAEPAERERQRGDGDQIHVAERRRGVAASLCDQRRDEGQRQRRDGAEPAPHAPVPSSRYAAKKRSAATPPGTRLPDHQKSQQFPAPSSAR